VCERLAKSVQDAQPAFGEEPPRYPGAVAIPSTYMGSVKNLDAILTQIRRGSVPPKFTYQFLKELGFPSSNDRPIIPIMKALGFLDDSGVPQERYRRFKDGSQWQRVLAEGVREAYADVFAVDENAHSLPAQQVNGIFARLSGKGEAVTDKMAMTFRALTKLADFSVDGAAPEEPEERQDEVEAGGEEPEPPELTSLSLRHDIHLHLPASDDVKVYDAIFRSLRDNLMT
jgi:hypothetical protein